MKAFVTVATLLLAVAGAHAGEVYKSTDAQGRPIYTDRPDSLPAQKVHVATQKPDAVAAQPQSDEKMKSYSEAEKARTDAAKKAADARQAKELSATDKARRCEESRANYQQMMTARRLYEPGSTPDERRYLDSNEIDAARADAKKLMDEFCADQ